LKLLTRRSRSPTDRGTPPEEESLRRRIDSLEEFEEPGIDLIFVVSIP